MLIEWLSVCTNITDIIIKHLVVILFEHSLQIHQNPGIPNWLQSKDFYGLQYINPETLDIC